MTHFASLFLDFLFFCVLFSVGVWVLLFWIVPQYQQTYPNSKITELISILYLKRGMVVAVFFVGFLLWLICYALVGFTGYLVSAASMGAAFFMVKYLAKLAGVDFEESIEDEKKRKEKDFDKFFR